MADDTLPSPLAETEGGAAAPDSLDALYDAQGDALAKQGGAENLDALYDAQGDALAEARGMENELLRTLLSEARANMPDKDAVRALVKRTGMHPDEVQANLPALRLASGSTMNRNSRRFSTS